MNATTYEILRQICNGGACPQTSVHTRAPQVATQTPSELIGQIIRPCGAVTSAGSVFSPSWRGT